MRDHRLLDRVLGFSFGASQLLSERRAILIIDEGMAQTMGPDFMSRSGNRPQKGLDPVNVTAQHKEGRSRAGLIQKLEKAFRPDVNPTLEPIPLTDRDFNALIPFLEVNRESVQLLLARQGTPPPYYCCRCHHPEPDRWRKAQAAPVLLSDI